MWVCVPKKVMWDYLAHRRGSFMMRPDYGFSIDNNGFDWKQDQDGAGYLYCSSQRHLPSESRECQCCVHQRTCHLDCTWFQSRSMAKTYQAPHILIATGSTPIVPPIPGSEHAITSDGFLRDGKDCPRKSPSSPAPDTSPQNLQACCTDLAARSSCC